MAKQKRSTRARRHAALKSKRRETPETQADARARYHYGHREFPMVAIRAMIDAATRFKGEVPLSVRGAIAASRAHAHGAVWNKLLKEGKAQDKQQWIDARDELVKTLRGEPPEAHWQRLLRDFERAVIAGDDHWFEQQAKAVRFTDTRPAAEKARARFEVAVLKEREELPDEAIAQDVLKRLEQRRDGKRFYVEGCLFSSGRRCREAIRRICEKNGMPLSG